MLDNLLVESWVIFYLFVALKKLFKSKNVIIIIFVELRGSLKKLVFTVREGEKFIQCGHVLDKGEEGSSDANVHTFLWKNNLPKFSIQYFSKYF